MFEQNKGGGSSPQASNLAGMFQNAGSFMPQQVNLPQITAPTAPMALQTAGQAGPMSQSFGSGTSKGTPNAVPGGGIEGMLAQMVPLC